MRTPLSVPKRQPVCPGCPLYFLTSYPSNFIGRVASSESCYVGPQAVANQVDVLQRHVGGFLRGNDKLKKKT